MSSTKISRASYSYRSSIYLIVDPCTLPIFHATKILIRRFPLIEIVFPSPRHVLSRRTRFGVVSLRYDKHRRDIRGTIDL